jgi:hypothetical protein
VLTAYLQNSSLRAYHRPHRTQLDASDLSNLLLTRSRPRLPRRVWRRRSWAELRAGLAGRRVVAASVAIEGTDALVIALLTAERQLFSISVPPHAQSTPRQCLRAHRIASAMTPQPLSPEALTDSLRGQTVMAFKLQGADTSVSFRLRDEAAIVISATGASGAPDEGRPLGGLIGRRGTPRLPQGARWFGPRFRGPRFGLTLGP